MRFVRMSDSESRSMILQSSCNYELKQSLDPVRHLQLLMVDLEGMSLAHERLNVTHVCCRYQETEETMMMTSDIRREDVEHY